MRRVVVLAEKPSVAREIAQVLGCVQVRDGYIEGAEYQITWAFGHLVGLSAPERYGYKEWRLETLPILPTEYLYELTGDARARKQFETIKRLFSEAAELVCACDAGREGEAIFRYIYMMCGVRRPVKRLWLSSLTPEAIRSGFANLREGNEFDPLYQAAKARNEADWAVGINATRALTLSARSPEVLSLGRVQTPTLAIVCERYLQHRDFTPTTYYLSGVQFEHGGKEYTLWHQEPFAKREEAAAFSEPINYLLVRKREEKEILVEPPLPYDLTTLQADANRLFGFKAQRTLEIAQSLYERKLLTYPRTSSRYLATDMCEGIERDLRKLQAPYPGYAPYLTPPVNRHCFDDTKLSDHHAIIPTFAGLDTLHTLKTEERKVYDRIVFQCIRALLPVCVKHQLRYTFGYDNTAATLSMTGSTVQTTGWQAINRFSGEEGTEGRKRKKSDGFEEPTDNTYDELPDLKERERLDLCHRPIAEKQPRKPPLHSEATLLKRMECAGREIEDEVLRRSIKECGIGTPATRAAIIETLKERGYMEVEKNKLLPTPLGLQVYHIVKAMDIGSPILTGKWEQKLSEIARGKMTLIQFRQEMNEYVPRLVEQIRGIAQARKAVPGIGVCPLCGEQVAERKEFYGCSGYANGCKFYLSKVIAGKRISEKQVIKLLTTGETDAIDGFKGKSGPFHASLYWDEEQRRVVFHFGNREPLCLCPKCRNGSVYEKMKSYRCDGCDFVIYKSRHKVILDREVVFDLCTRRISEKIEGFRVVRKVGDTEKERIFSAKLMLTKAHTIRFIYD